MRTTVSSRSYDCGVLPFRTISALRELSRLCRCCYEPQYRDDKCKSDIHNKHKSIVAYLSVCFAKMSDRQPGLKNLSNVLSPRAHLLVAWSHGVDLCALMADTADGQGKWRLLPYLQAFNDAPCQRGHKVPSCAARVIRHLLVMAE